MTRRPVVAENAPLRTKPSNYPEPFASMMAGRQKRPLGDLFGLTNFGVNLTRLVPGAVSALQHVHTKQEEFIYILEGHPTLVLDGEATPMEPGMVMGFAAGGVAHHVENRTDADCVILEIGDRSIGDEVRYPVDDIQALMGADGKWMFARKDGAPY
ncbi:cupin domain-containing protein [Rhizobium panacihumi]|uniref:cupin domain-containing protein n=1 Tax=Rhizobium panacihumi TaxID=2008450 RepID=UPI003D791603